MRKRITGVFAASAAAMLMLAGCGGGSGFSDDGNASAEGGLTNDSSQELTVLIGSATPRPRPWKRPWPPGARKPGRRPP